MRLLPALASSSFYYFQLYRHFFCFFAMIITMITLTDFLDLTQSFQILETARSTIVFVLKVLDLGIYLIFKVHNRAFDIDLRALVHLLIRIRRNISFSCLWSKHCSSVGAVSSLLFINWTGSFLIAEINSLEILSWLLVVYRFVFIRHEGYPAYVFVLTWMRHSQRVGLFSFQNGRSLILN